MIEIIVMCTIFGAFIFLSFITGLSYGTKIKNNEKIELPNPVRYIKDKNIQKQLDESQAKKQAITEVNLYNIENYDGTGLGQKEIPR